ncbi:hypothetical protein BCR37DRAFT_376405 [Protomyces lactucae-debilis]|uniref:Uncharacterized protein n=1 Tax=Protomyces lactucae-debilis TaxID=2754530 RepID=A0A1Y2FSR5_PROLT|nr:uncharacterized protein BCR37DRAFT_376405 [Protomyces lactucae-debilis]ORY87043.1 hypothetical protein BCR37DRAFT_376405 [Protomyces lactucae-debilis]
MFLLSQVDLHSTVLASLARLTRSFPKTELFILLSSSLTPFINCQPHFIRGFDYLCNFPAVHLRVTAALLRMHIHRLFPRRIELYSQPDLLNQLCTKWASSLEVHFAKK